MLKELEREYVLTKKGKPVEFAALSFDYLGGKDVMPVGGYWGPYRSGGEVRGHVLPNLLCEQSFCDIAEVGVNMIVSRPWKLSAGGIRCTKRGIRFLSAVKSCRPFCKSMPPAPRFWAYP